VETDEDHTRLRPLEHIRRLRRLPQSAALIGQNSLYSVAGLVLPAIALLVATPFLVHQLGTTDYGLWVLTTSFLGVVGFFDLGLSTALAKFVAQYRATGDIDRLSASVTMGVALYLVVAVVLTPVVFFAAPSIASAIGSDAHHAKLTTATRLVSLAITPLLLKNAALAVPIGLQRFRVPMAAAILQALLTLGLALAAAYLTGSVSVVVGTTVVAIWVTAAVAVVFAYRALTAMAARWVFSMAHLRTIGRFMVFTAGTALGGVLFASLDRIAVGVVAGLSAVTYYTVSIAVAQNLLTVADVLSRPLMPAASEWASNDEWARVRRWLLRSTASIAVLECIAGAILLAISEPFMRAWMGASFTTHALSGFRILIVVFTLTAIGAPAFHIANGTGHPWAPALGGTAGGTLTLVLIVVLAPRWHATGAAFANVGAWLALFPLIYMWHRLGVRRS
jgi:O-antigen/teichoic acid export membrane protein